MSENRRRQAGIDPGIKTGWAVIEFTARGNVNLVAAGTISAAGAHGLTTLRRELTGILEAAPLQGISIEELMETKRDAPTYCPKLAYWAEGVILQLLDEMLYPPARSFAAVTVKSILGCRDKGEIREFVKAVVGQTLAGRPDHETDALGIAIAGMMREHGVIPKIKWSIELSKKQARRFAGPKGIAQGETLDASDPKAREELLEALRTGKAHIKRGWE